MANETRSARDSARWTDDESLWLDHVTLVDEDVAWLAGAKHAILWNVKFPTGFLAQLPRLEHLDVRGGTREDADFIEGCNGLRSLRINQVRGLANLSAVERAGNLEFLALYGLPRLIRMPSLAGLRKLDRVEVGSMKGLRDISGLLQAPALTELVFIRMVGVSQTDAASIAAHRSVERFSWFAEDVPVGIWVPFVERVGKSEATFDWWDRRFRA
jgi:hypothetical protein